MIRRSRSKSRPGRLQGDALAKLRMACWLRDDGMCHNCGRETNILVPQESDIAYHMAHIKAKRMGGDSLDNVRTECGKCHREYHHFGPSRVTQILPRMLNPRNSGGKVAPAGWGDACLYPSLTAGGGGYLAANALCFIPYVHVCWMVKPPVEVRTDDSGHLHSDSGPAMRFSDGFEVFVRRDPEPETYEAVERLSDPSINKCLPAPEEDND